MTTTIDERARELSAAVRLLMDGWEVSRASLYDEEGVEGWCWTKDDQEYCEIGSWDELPTVPDALLEPKGKAFPEAAASNTTAEVYYGHCDTCGADCDTDGCTKDRSHEIAIDPTPASDSGRGDRATAWDGSRGFDKKLDGYPVLSPEGLAAIATDPEYQARIVQAVNGWKAMRQALIDAEKFMRVARNYFPKSIRNTDKFNLENTNAAIGKALALADPQP